MTETLVLAWLYCTCGRFLCLNDSRNVLDNGTIGEVVNGCSQVVTEKDVLF